MIAVGSVAVIATAAVAAGALLEIFFFWQAPEFQGLGDLLGHRFLELMQGLLRIEEASRHRIAQNRFTLLLKFADFFAGKRQRAMLLLMQLLALLHQGFVLGAGF